MQKNISVILFTIILSFVCPLIYAAIVSDNLLSNSAILFPQTYIQSTKFSVNKYKAKESTIDLQVILDQIVKSNEAVNSHITGVPISFQCNSVNNGQPIAVASGKIRHNGGAIPIDAIFQIGSLSKSFIAVVALQLEAEGAFGINVT